MREDCQLDVCLLHVELDELGQRFVMGFVLDVYNVATLSYPT
jgi:hypothetical protein